MGEFEEEKSSDYRAHRGLLSVKGEVRKKRGILPLEYGSCRMLVLQRSERIDME